MREIAAARITADQLRVQALRQSGASFVTAFHSNPCAMSITRLSDRRFQDVNESFERQTGFCRAEVIGRSVEEFGMWVDPRDLTAVRLELRRNGKVSSREVRFRTKSGVPSTAVYCADIIEFDGERCVLATCLDITERKSAEIRAAALREELAHLGRVATLDLLTGSLAHELNQPLTAVMANAAAALHLLATQPPPLRELREALNEILIDTKRASDVLVHIRTLLKKGPTRYERIDLNNVISEVVKLSQGNAVHQGIVLDVEPAPDLEPVQGSRVQIQQVVLNILMNAFDAVRERDADDRRVRLRTSRRDLAAVVEVSDQGSGLSDEALARIFEPFYTTKRDGMGLGLSICRAIVAAHGGTLDATRNPGTGMTVSASFPLWRPAKPDRPPSPAARQVQERR
jgi:two-component system, LuxR family, sensor kinase FixL